MVALVVIGLIALVVFTAIAATIIAWESLPMNRTPAWLDNLYYFITRN